MPTIGSRKITAIHISLRMPPELPISTLTIAKISNPSITAPTKLIAGRDQIVAGNEQAANQHGDRRGDLGPVQVELCACQVCPGGIQVRDGLILLGLVIS